MDEERRRRRDRSLVTHGLAALLVIAVVAVVWQYRLRPNPDYQAAAETTAAIDAAHAAIVDGTVTLSSEPTEVADGVTGAIVPRGDTEVAMLVAPSGDECYAVWWDATGTRRGRVLAYGLACEPAPVVASNRPADALRFGPPVLDPAGPYDWEDPFLRLLPDREVLELWAIPALIVGAALTLNLLVGISHALLTGEPARLWGLAPSIRR